MEKEELKEFLDEMADKYNSPEFIATDPILIPHQFTLKEDIEIAGFLSATIAWGNRKTIINNAQRMMALMGNSPYDFVMHFNNQHLEKLSRFKHRTFNGTDFVYFVRALKHIYSNHGGLEDIFNAYKTDDSLQPAIHQLKNIFFEIPHPVRSTKHLSDPRKGSAAKRLNMFLRWMVRKDKKGVDFGIWHNISTSILSCPLDVHTGNIARKLDLINRKQNDQKALHELDACLRRFDSIDPVKYDFALFGLGINKQL